MYYALFNHSNAPITVMRIINSLPPAAIFFYFAYKGGKTFGNSSFYLFNNTSLCVSK